MNAEEIFNLLQKNLNTGLLQVIEWSIITNGLNIEDTISSMFFHIFSHYLICTLSFTLTFSLQKYNKYIKGVGE